MRCTRFMLIAFAVGLIPGVIGAQADRFALVIGIAGYPQFDVGKRLRYADRDADEFARFLESPQGGAFPASHVKVLTNGAATRTAVSAAIDTLQRQITPGSLLYVFFSGHTGVDARGFAYLLPYDADPTRPQDRGWRISAFQNDLRQIGAQFFILFLDACHAGAASVGDQTVPDDDDGSKGDDEVSVKLHVEWNRAFERLRSQDGVIFSSSANQESYEDEEYRHGLFTYYLLRGLRGAADSVGVGNRDGTVTVWELMRFLSDSVPARAKRIRGKYQVPDMTQALSPTFPLAKYSLNVPGPRLLETATTARTHFDAAYRFAADQNESGAIGEYRLALALDPNYSAARNNLAVSLEHTGDAAGAIREYRETIRRDPTHALARRNLAIHMAASGDTLGALSQLREAVRLDPGLANAQSDLGNLQRLRHQYDSARVHLARAYRLDSLSAAAWARYGALQADQGYIDVGILFESWGLSLADRPESGTALSMRAWIADQLSTLYDSAHDREAALRILSDAARRDPSQQWANTRASIIASKLQSLSDSVDRLNAVLAASPANTDAFRQLHFILHEELLRPGDALRSTERWQATNPAEDWLHEDRAENLFTAQRFAEADVAINAELSRATTPVSSRVALLALSVANDLAQGRTSAIDGKLQTLEGLISAQPDTFTVQWIFYGTRSTIRRLDNIRSDRKSTLLDLFAALGRPSKKDILAGIRRSRSAFR